MTNQENSIEHALAEVIMHQALKQSIVAIPGFGSFAGVKHEERIVINTESGVRTLLPPKIELVFSPSVILRKKI